MRLWKSAVIFMLLMAGHFILPPWGMVILYACIGSWLALVSGTGRYPGLIIPFLELLSGLAYRIFVWNGQPLKALSVNFGILPEMLTGIVIAVNMLTAFLVSFTFFYWIRLYVRFRSGHK